jgi:hypothetical protein
MDFTIYKTTSTCGLRQKRFLRQGYLIFESWRPINISLSYKNVPKKEYHNSELMIPGGLILKPKIKLHLKFFQYNFNFTSVWVINYETNK